MNVAAIAKTVVGFVKKNSPVILAIVGVGSIATGSVVLAKKAKNSHQIDHTTAEELDEAREVVKADPKAKKQLAKAYCKAGFRYIKYYSVPILLISGGTSSLIGALVIQSNRLKQMAAAYTALASAFATYRQRVAEAIGEDHENDLFHGIKRDKDGNAIPASDEVVNKPLDSTQTFSRLYADGNSIYWSKDPRMNIAHLRGAESTCNAILRENGFITLNQVYRELGFEPSSEGLYLGWRFKYGDPVYGSTYIDFGFSGPKNEAKVEKIRNDWNTGIWIDLVPPHNLIGAAPKERIRTYEDKLRILKHRKCLGSYVSNMDDSRDIYHESIQNEYLANVR